jgi:hypothetical protein
MTIVGTWMTKISLGLTVEFYVALVHLISTTTKSSFFSMECQLVEFLHDFSLTQRFAHPLENKKHSSGKGNLQMIKKTLHFLLNFLQISTIFASFSRAHAGTLQNHSISPCTTTV